MRTALGAIAFVFVLAGASRGSVQDEAIILKTPVTRDAVITALSGAATELHTTGSFDRSGNHWRSGLIVHPVGNGGRMGISVVLLADISTSIPDTTQITFHYSVSGSNGVNALGRDDLIIFVAKTRQHLANP